MVKEGVLLNKTELSRVRVFNTILYPEYCWWCNNPATINSAKEEANFIKKNGKLFCEVCGNQRKRKNIIIPEIRKELKLYFDTKSYSINGKVSTLLHLNEFCLFFKKPLKNIKKEDIASLNRFLDDKYPKVNSINDIKRAVKSYYNWFADYEENEFYKKISKGIELSKEDTEAKKPREIKLEDMAENIKKIINVADNFRDKALISMMSEWPGRNNEWIAIKVNDIEIRDDSVRVKMLSSKRWKNNLREKRTLPFKNSYFFITQYYNSHPLNPMNVLSDTELKDKKKCYLPQIVILPPKHGLA